MKEPIKNRYEATLLFDATYSNPNGDPDNGNMPRIDPETMCGIVTDGCLKRKIRNYVDVARSDEYGYAIYVTEGVPLNMQHRKAYDALGLKPETKKLPKDKGKAQMLPAKMAEMFYDIRAFGAAMTNEVNCGQVRGPVQIAQATSIDPILPMEISLTRVTVTREDEDKDHDMGNKFIIPYGLYRADMYVSAMQAKKVGFSEEDLALLWEALLNMFDFDRSSARGKLVTQKLIVFKHESSLGNAPSNKLFDLVKVQLKEPGKSPRRFSDYDVFVDAENVPAGIEIIEML